MNDQRIKVTAIADNAFRKDKKLTTVRIGKYVRSIGKNAFAGCVKLKSVKGGTKVITIMDNAFSGCRALKTFPVMNSLQKIGANGFNGDKALSKFTLAKAVKSIGKNAFKGCAGLKTVTVKTEKLTTKNVGANAFKGINKKAIFKCPKKQMKKYKTLFVKKGAPKTCKFMYWQRSSLMAGEIPSISSIQTNILPLCRCTMTMDLFYGTMLRNLKEEQHGTAGGEHSEYHFPQ